MSIAIESAELMELFSAYKKNPKMLSLRLRDNVKDEIADIFIYLIAFAIK